MEATTAPPVGAGKGNRLDGRVTDRQGRPFVIGWQIDHDPRRGAHFVERLGDGGGAAGNVGVVLHYTGVARHQGRSAKPERQPKRRVPRQNPKDWPQG